MSEEFASAAMRHHSDANFLGDDGRLDNSGYLAGYVVECSLKVLVECCQEGPRGLALGHDLTNLAGRALTLAALLTPGVSRYDVTDDTDICHVLREWRSECRYGATGQTTVEEMKTRRRAAQVCIDRILLPLILDGVLGVPQ